MILQPIAHWAAFFDDLIDLAEWSLGCDAEGALEDDSIEIQQAVSHIAEAALLGVGDASKMFPESLEEMYASYASNEMGFRVIL